MRNKNHVLKIIENGTVRLLAQALSRHTVFSMLKGLSHEMDLAFENIYGKF